MKRIFSGLFFVLIIPAIAVLCFVLPAPAFAGMQMVDENELSQTHASVTGAPIKGPVADVDRNAGRTETWQASGTMTGASAKDQSVGVEKGATSLETLQASGTTLDKDKMDAVFSASVNKTLDGIGLGGLNIGGQKPFQSYSEGVNINITGNASFKLR